MTIRHLFASALLLLALGPLTVLAADNDPLPHAFVERDIAENNGLGIALAARPLWHFARNRGQKTCLPESAITENGEQTPPLEPELFPLAGNGCPEPGVPVGGEREVREGFPTYYTVSWCGEDEIRVVYNLFFRKDGFKKVYLSPCNGHPYDWERIIVLWTRPPSSSSWVRTGLLTSFHQGYHFASWPSLPHTFNHADPNLTSGTNLDGPKIFVGWGKHAMFTSPNTAWTDCFNQGCAREFRTNDWTYLPRETDLVYAGAGSEVGEKLRHWRWGMADSHPTRVERRVCQQDGRMKGPECLMRSVCEEMEEMGEGWSVRESVFKERMGWREGELVDDGGRWCEGGEYGRVCREDPLRGGGKGRVDL